MVAHDFTLDTYAGTPAEILADFRRLPEVTGRPGMNLETAAKLCCRLVERRAKAALVAEIKPKMQAAYDLHYVLNGPHPNDRDAASEWESALDDRVEAIFPDYIGLLSASWLGVHTIDTHYWEEGDIAKEANSFANEAYRQLTWLEMPHREDSKPKTINQILSSVGIVGSDLESALEDVRSVPREERLKQMSARLNAVLQKIYTAFPGANWNEYKAFFEANVDNAADDDDGLASSGASVLRIGLDDIEPLRLYRQGTGEGWAGKLFEMLKVAPTLATDSDSYIQEVDMQPVIDWAALGIPAPTSPQGVTSQPLGAPPAPLPPPGAWGAPPPPLPAAVAPPPPPNVAIPAPPSRRRSAGDGPPTGDAAALVHVLGLIRNNTSMTDVALSEGLGVARATVNHYANGKARFVPDDAQRKFIESVVRDTHNAMLTAMRLLNMTPTPQQPPG